MTRRFACILAVLFALALPLLAAPEKAKETKKDAWINIPYYADDNYIDNLVALIASYFPAPAPANPHGKTWSRAAIPATIARATARRMRPE